MVEKATGGVIANADRMWADDEGCDYIVHMTRRQYDELSRDGSDAADPRLVDLVRRVREGQRVGYEISD